MAVINNDIRDAWRNGLYAIFSITTPKITQPKIDTAIAIGKAIPWFNKINTR